MKSWIKKITVYVAIATVPVGLLEITRPTPVLANQFDTCIRQIAGAGVSPRDAAQACSDALIPKELSRCVAMINSRTPIDGQSALLACYQVRRPIDLANCVVDIHRAVPAIAAAPATKQDKKAPSELSLQTLDSCRKSLLPGRFSECVIATSRDVAKETPAEALDTCLSAEDFPRDLFPAYPQNQNLNELRP
ncbi:hypothetical protein [Pannus brasiliensis]